jgi:hypothetical protein
LHVNLFLRKVDVKDKKGGQTPLYLAVKSGLVEVTRLLIENGADVENVCYGRSIAKLIEEKMPDLHPESIPRFRDVASNDVSGNDLERMKNLIERAALIDDRNNPMRVQYFSEFRTLVYKSDPKEMVSIFGFEKQSYSSNHNIIPGRIYETRFFNLSISKSFFQRISKNNMALIYYYLHRIFEINVC